MKKWISLLSLTLVLGACSFGSGSDDQSKDYKEQNEGLLRDFDTITGTYVGDISAYKQVRGSGSLEVAEIPLELGVYVEYATDGKDNDGKTKLRPVLKVRYRQLDTVRSDLILDARYLPFSGELDAASATGSTTVRGVLKGQELSGTIVRNGGTLGKFAVKLNSKSVLAPYSDQDVYERMVEQYKRIVGLYVGIVTADNQAPFPVQIQLSFTPQANEDGSLTAKLRAAYKRLDFADPSITERLLTVNYRLDTDPAELVMSGDGSTAQIPNAYFMSLSGTLENDTYTASFTDRRGYVGVLTVTKKPK